MPANSTPIICNQKYDNMPVMPDNNVFINKYFFILSSMLSMIKRAFLYSRLFGISAENFLLNVLCSMNINIMYINIMPVDVRMPATDEPIFAAMFATFGIMLASK